MLPDAFRLSSRTSPFRGTLWVRFVIGAAVLAATIGVIGLAYWLVTDSRDSSPVSEVSQGGGGGVASGSLLELFDSLPFPAGTTFDQSPVGNGDAVLATYWVERLPDSVVSFYSTTLPQQGWTVESSGPVVSDPKDDGTRLTSTSLVYVNGDKRLSISIGLNRKDPSRGQARMAITAQPR